MATKIRASIVRIGNSRGIRIPKVLLAQLDLGEEVELSIQRDRLVIRGAHRPRAGWDTAFRAMHARGDDRLIDRSVSTAWDEKDWTW
jgi:antitoxin MazE